MKYSTDLHERCRGILFGRHLCQLAVVEIVLFPSSVPRQSFPFGDVTHLFIRPCADTTDMLGAGERKPAAAMAPAAPTCCHCAHG